MNLQQKFLRDFGKAALIHRDCEISYAEVISMVSRFSLAYALERGGRVAVFAENRPEWIYALYSAWAKGGIAVPIDYLSPAPEAAYILGDCRPATVFCSAATREVLLQAVDTLEPGYRPAVIVFEEMALPPGPAIAPAWSGAELTDTAVIIYTSGTTGSPKGVMLSYDNLLSNIEAVTDDVPVYTSADRLLAILPFHHSFPLQGTILIPFCCGATVALLDRVSSQDILGALARHRITIILGVPRLYRLFHKGLMDKVNAGAVGRSLFKVSRTLCSRALGRLVFARAQQAFGGHIKYFVSGGAKLDEQVWRDLDTLGFEVLEGYGMTEASPMITFTRPGQGSIGSAGVPISQTTVRISGGQITASGRNIMQGYWNKPEDTASVLRDGWLHTGDRGFLDGRNRLRITGRTKEIIVLSSGKNVNPEEIENRILSLSPLIKEIGVYPREERLGAVIHPDAQVVKQGRVVNLRETIRWLVLDKFNLTVPGYKKIHQFTLIDHELPKTRLGKLKRFLLPQLAVRAERPAQESPVPQSREFRMLAEYLAAALDTQVHPADHLEYDLGLDSLAKIELDLFLERTFGMVLPEDQPASHHTVEQLAEIIALQKTRSEAEAADWHGILQETVGYLRPRSIYMQRLVRAMAAPVFRTYFRLRGEGLERLPRSPFIMALNHQSFYDGMFLSVLLPDRMLKDTFFLAAGKHVKSPLSRYYARHSNLLVMDINRDLKRTLQQAAAILREGKNLVIFPEGARSRDGRLIPFKRTFAILSKELNVPVVPVAVSGAYAAFPIDRRLPRAGRIRLAFLPPIYPESLDYAQITEKTQLAIAACL